MRLRRMSICERKLRRSAQRICTCRAFAYLMLAGLAIPPAMRAQGQTQGEMNRTAGKAYQQADAQMNAAYKKLMKVLDAEQKQQLVSAQQAWLKFRDADALLRSSKVKGGSIYPMIYAGHLQEITQARTRELAGMYKLFTTEGDM